MSNGLLLWVDDEMELLRAHIIFLEKKGYEVVTATNGTDAIELCNRRTFDLILLDEMMPGLSGLETLQKLKNIQPATPVVMVTKSEEEDIMNQAIGSKIADYLIKPVNPVQILLTLKKNIHQREIVAEVTQSGYRQNFQDIAMQIADCRTVEDWTDVYKRLVHWELELTGTETNMNEILQMQKEEANAGFAKFIKNKYLTWVDPKTIQTAERPVMSPDIFKKKIFPLLSGGEKVFLVVIDNFRYDQWRVLAQEIGDMFDIEEDTYLSILPTATQYARNAIFSGLMPLQIAEMFPELWVDEDEAEGKNLNEEPLIRTQIERYRRHDTFSYHKINDSSAAERFLGQLNQMKQNDLNVVVINFIDMLSHARTESKMVRELANNESAYRSITLSWFRHSVMAELLKALAQSEYTVVVTTDHGSIRANRPVKIIGDRNTNTNLRYKLGKNLAYNPKEVFTIKNPKQAQLPAPNLSTSYVFATGNSFLAYPNNYNYYVSYYKDTFQHGGISMEEMLIPLVTLRGRKRKS
ncbi:MAG: bifunctional response regulator/alkaline phosphatase family protein [Prevotella sp.]|uniref:T9SS response regulator signal transducer PorX n=1 Tax=Prevotella sp. TaxID=59823 RepID=UPI002A2650CB|nr:bifunctional response regulator/alkaline phosphatase family protein [Prevotella sp.]MDD7317367.1 bifunctional response regulator/alkaline phosphatase family protein [Prevotellaceae bacterium]MDY4019465.1 bifunctional response regulator/alkaline phosphatase family protein [Prevotella sp.]